MAPLTQMMIVRAAGRHTARVFGYAAIPILLGPLLGPVLAGAILQHASWRWLFLVNIPVGLLGIVLAIRFLPEDRAEARPRDLDFVGFCLLSPGLAALDPAPVKLNHGMGMEVVGDEEDEKCRRDYREKNQT